MRRGALRIVSLAAMLIAPLALAAPPPRPTQMFDWCSEVVVRPDQRFQPNGDHCAPEWSDAAIAGGAGVVLLGSYDDVSDMRFAHEANSPCGWPTSHAANGRYVTKLRAMRGTLPPLRVIHMNRFDIVSDSLAALPGFRADFLVSTDRPWSEVTDFLAKDRSPICGSDGCRWTDNWGGVEGSGKGTLRDRIDAVGGKGRADSAIYYLVRPAQVQRFYWPLAAMADLRNSNYRAWRIGEARRAIEQGGYDAVALNHKFHQFYEPHWIASAAAPDAAALRAHGDDTLWTAPPRGYGFLDYLQGWLALATDLREAGVPYAIIDMPGWPWLLRPGDPRLPDPDLARRIREAIRGARIVLLERRASTDPAGLDAFAAELQSAGVQVVWVEAECGLQRR